jgi:hypothetical protein
VTFSLLRPQSEHLPFAGSGCVTIPMVPTSAPVNGGWWEVAPQTFHDAWTRNHTLEHRPLPRGLA